MGQAVEEKTVELMDRTADAIEVFAIKLAALADTYGPEVADAVLWIARIDALNYLGTSLVYLIIGSILLLLIIEFYLMNNFDNDILK